MSDIHRRRDGRFTVAGVASGGLTHLFLAVWALMVAFPFLWMVYSSIKTDRDIFFSPWSLPSTLHFDNFARAWTQASIGRYFLNSLIVIPCAIVLTLLLSSMTSYVLARYRFLGNRFIYYAFILGITFPVFLAVVPLFFTVHDLGLLNTFPGLILVYVAYSLPFSVFFLTTFFKTLPDEIAEAGLIDGASHFGIFFRLMLPLATPGLVSIGIFNFLGMWNQYLLPIALNTNQNNYLLAQGLVFLTVSQGYHSDYSALFAGLTITTLPVLVVYIALQNRLEAGLTAGAIK